MRKIKKRVKKITLAFFSRPLLGILLCDRIIAKKMELIPANFSFHWTNSAVVFLRDKISLRRDDIRVRRIA